MKFKQMSHQTNKLYNDRITRDAVKELMINTARDCAVEAIKKGEDANGFKRAFEVIDASFQKMKKLAE